MQKMTKVNLKLKEQIANKTCQNIDRCKYIKS